MTSRLYSATEVEERTDFHDMLDVVERTYAESARGRILNPPKLGMHMGDDGEWPDMNAFSIDMPAYVDWLGVAGTKWAVATWDAETDTPISSLILLFDLRRGEFEAVMEGMYLTGVRTALQSVVGLEHLAPTYIDSVGVVGAGFQARFQLQVIDELLTIDTFRLFDIDAERARALENEMSPRLDANIVVEDTPQEAVTADAVVTVTDSKSPVLKEDWLDDSGLIVALGSYQELPDETVLGADHVFVDHVEQCLQRGALSDLAARGELARDDIDETIGAALDEDLTQRVRRGDRVVFVPIGLGSLDVALAEYVHTVEGDGAEVQTFDFV